MASQTKKQVVPLQKRSLLALVENSIGSIAFRNLYALVDGEEKDIVNGGEDSCAFFVSSVLLAVSSVSLKARLMEEVHATVDGTIRDLEKMGWKEIADPISGCVIVWEPKTDRKGESHRHVGFSLGDKQAVSNGPEERLVVKHHITFGEADGRPKRRIEKCFLHPFLAEEISALDAKK